MIKAYIHNQILQGGTAAATPEYPDGAYCKINQRKFVSVKSGVPSVWLSQMYCLLKTVRILIMD